MILQRNGQGSALSSAVEMIEGLSPVAYPNPFSGSVNLIFNLEQSTTLIATISDPSGRIIRIIEKKTLGKGEHSFSWDGKTGHGLPSPPGLYILTLITGEGHIKQFLLLKQE